MFLRAIGSLLLMIAAAWPASAAVTITFYSHDFGSRFPHAFVVLEGTPDGGGAAIAGNYGFTAKRVTPAILTGAVAGDIESASPGYVAASQAHWRMILNDGQYAAVLATMERWRAIPGRSYDLNRRNCIHFVADIARTLGLDVAEPRELMKKPRSFLQSLFDRNRLLAIAGASAAPPLLRAPAATAAIGAPVAPPPLAPAMAEGAARSASAIAPDRAQGLSATSTP